MNAKEREDVEKIRKRWKQPMGDFARIAYSDADIESLLDIIDRHDRLANEGLTEEEQQNIAIIGDLNDLSIHDHGWMVVASVVVKLQARLADALSLRDVLLNDYVGENAKLLAVREEAARECMRLIEAALLPEVMVYGGTVRNWVQIAKEVICRRFSLAASQPAEPAEVCQRCNGTRSINTGPGDYGDEYIPCPDCNPAAEQQMPEVCQRCEGSKEVARYQPSAVTTCCGRKTQTRSDINQSRDGILPVWCSVCWATYLPEHSGYMPCPDCAGSEPTDDRRSVRRCLEDQP